MANATVITMQLSLSLLNDAENVPELEKTTEILEDSQERRRFLFCFRTLGVPLLNLWFRWLAVR